MNYVATISLFDILYYFQEGSKDGIRICERTSLTTSTSHIYPLLTSSSRPIGKYSQAAYYAYRLHTRRDGFKILHNAGRLYQEFIIDSYAQIDQNRLRWNRMNQDTLRVDQYQNIADAVGDGLTLRNIG